MVEFVPGDEADVSAVLEVRFHADVESDQSCRELAESVKFSVASCSVLPFRMLHRSFKTFNK